MKITYKVEGKDILKNPPQDLVSTKFNREELEGEIKALLEKYKIHRLEAKVID